MTSEVNFVQETHQSSVAVNATHAHTHTHIGQEEDGMSAREKEG